jgi:diguanylate cyclase (GGDEF)-like protein
MFHAMESIGFKRICCLEVDEPSAKLEVKLSQAASGSSRVPEKAWIPFPTDKVYLSTPQIISRDDRHSGHQLVLELIGVSSAVVAPLQCTTPGRRMVLCADRGPAGHAPISGEDRALGIIADEVSLLIKYAELTREKERMATQDPLTGAATRRRMMDRLDYLMTQALRTRMPFSLIIMDLDHFKKFNDTMGHQTGDKLLQDLVKLLQANVRKGDLVARYGGEEFVVLLPNCDLEAACTVGEDLRRKVFTYGESSLEDYKGLQVSISMGAAQWSTTETALGLIGRADAALYEAKHAGRNRVLRAA